MARARNIKPGFFTNDILGELEPLARLLFAGLWCHADRAGRLEDRPKKLKAEILPYDDCDVNGLIQCLHSAGMVQRYVVDGKAYIQIVKFEKHQNPHVKEAASQIPAPDLHSASLEKHEASRADSLNLIPDSLKPQTFKTICTERKTPRSALPIGEGDLVATLPSIKGDIEVRKSFVAELMDVYPGVMVAQEIDKARLWLLANPTKRKGNVRRFLTNWIARQQERA